MTPTPAELRDGRQRFLEACQLHSRTPLLCEGSSLPSITHRATRIAATLKLHRASVNQTRGHDLPAQIPPFHVHPNATANASFRQAALPTSDESRTRRRSYSPCTFRAQSVTAIRSVYPSASTLPTRGDLRPNLRMRDDVNRILTGGHNSMPAGSSGKKQRSRPLSSS